jgi:hypothetical protein
MKLTFLNSGKTVIIVGSLLKHHRVNIQMEQC